MEKINKPVANRLQSLDALRGFDMFWIMGGRYIFLGLATLTGLPFFEAIAGQMRHVAWHGFAFYDMIFPLFLFIAGISFPFSLSKRMSVNSNRGKIYYHIIRRGLLLVLLGIIYNNGVNFDFRNLAYSSVLGIIGLSWMFSALIYLNTNLTFRIFWFSGLLLLYWLSLALFQVYHPDVNGFFPPDNNLTDFINRAVMPGKFGNSEQLYTLLPATGTALLGMFTGEYIQSGFFKARPVKKVMWMILAGIILIIIGKTWDIVFPINKHLWTSSYVCFVGGLSVLLFAFFYLVIEIWQYKKWAFVFIVIGLNPITIYFGRRIIDFKYTGHFFFDGISALLPESWTQMIDGIGLTAVCWVFLYILYKKKIFIKV